MWWNSHTQLITDVENFVSSRRWRKTQASCLLELSASQCARIEHEDPGIREVRHMRLFRQMNTHLRRSRLATLKAAMACLVMASLPAFAFQESKVAPGEKSGAAAPIAPQVQTLDGKPGLQLSVPEAGKGTEVRIPGLGKLGVLPKLDFGLDILYGATDDRRQAPGSQGTSDEVTIKGIIKHKF